jgi:WD40 repeat protein/tRNA A-37 threonylcarbamoyl transferase component Bud32
MSRPEDQRPPEPGETLIQSEATAQAAREFSAPKEALQHADAPVLAGYRLCQPIGRGAYAEVWRGWQERTRKWVAVKVFRQKSGLNWMLLQREVERLVSLDKHPYIVSLLDADLSGPTAYYVLDLIEAGSLERLSPASSTEGVEKTARLLEEVGEALAYVHSKGIIHCDLKPANILMDDQGRPRVADFGQSRVFSDSSAALGTLFYMAPEQAMPATESERSSPDVRWDVYALGATFYSLLTGEIPHAAAGRAHVSAEAPVEQRLKAYREAVFADARPRIDDPIVDEDLAAIVEKCLAPKPEDRYQTVADVLRDLQRRRQMKPVSPLAADPKYRARKFLQRNRVLVAISAAALAALVVAGVRLVEERDNLRRQLAVSFLARGQLEFLKGNPLRAITYGAHANMLEPSDLARSSTLWYLSATTSPRMVYPAEGPSAFSPDGRLTAASDPAFGAEIRDVATARPVAGPLRTRGDILAMAFSRDGRLLATGTRDKEARVWYARTGKPFTGPLEHDSAVTALAVSPDARWLAVGGAGGAVRLWSLPAGTQASVTPKHDNRVTFVQFSPDGGLLLTASELDHTAKLWRIPSGESLAVIRLGERVHGAAWSPDGTLVATAGGDRTVRLWDARDGKPVGKPMPHQSHVLAVAFSPDGKRLIAGGWDSLAQIWDVATQTPIGKPMKSGGDVTAAAFSPDGHLVATASADTTAQIWDAQTQEPYGRSLEHPTAVRGVLFTPDGAGLLTQSVGGSARLWRVQKAPVSDRVLVHDSGIWDASFSPDGSKIVTGSKDNKARIWDAATGALLETLPHQARVPAARFSPDGRTVMTGSLDGRVRLWDAATGRLIKEAAHGDKLSIAQYSRDGRLILSADNAGLIRLWRAADLEPLPFTILHPGELMAASLSPDGSLVLSAGQDNTARLWDAATGRPVGKPMQHDDDVNCAVFSPDGKLVLTGSSDLTARLWRVPSGEPAPGVRLMRHKDGVKAAAFSSDGKKMVTAGLDQRMRVWDTATGRGLGQLMTHAGVILAVAFSPDGSMLLSAGADHLARLWDVETSIAVRSFKHDDAVIAAAFSPDGRRILTASSDSTARVWDVPWLTQQITPNELKRLADRATIKEIGSTGEMVTISQSEWEDAFLKQPPREP